LLPFARNRALSPKGKPDVKGLYRFKNSL